VAMAQGDLFRITGSTRAVALLGYPVSHSLSILQRAGLVEARRQGQWTYYKRNDKALKALSRFLRDDL